MCVFQDKKHGSRQEDGLGLLKTASHADNYLITYQYL